nr:uncharacterized protein LOC110073495 [Pogona vitticeps]
MKKENNAQVKIIQYDKNYKQKINGKFMKKQDKNGILPWKKMDRMKKKLQTNESGHQRFEERSERAQPFLCQETTQSLSISTENTSEGFKTEPTLSNDSGITGEFMSYDGYVPYYRTYAKLVETPVCMNVDLKQENAEKGGVQSNGCVFNPQYEDEPSNVMGIFATGYFPYYRTREEHFSTSDFPCESHSTAESGEAETNKGGEEESEIDHDAEDAFENMVVQENHETYEDTSQWFDFLENHTLTDSVTESCDSKSSLLGEISNLNQSPSSSDYFPYYRTYGNLLLGPMNSNHVCHSSRDELEGFDVEIEETMRGTRDHSKSCSVYLCKS